MADRQDQIRRTLEDHWFYDDTDTCECGYWAHFDSVRRHHIEDMLVAALSAPPASTEGDAALIRMSRNDALRRAADALEAQPPKLKAQYVATLRLYADEPERLGLAAASPPGCTCSRGTESNVVCPVHVVPSAGTEADRG